MSYMPPDPSQQPQNGTQPPSPAQGVQDSSPDVHQLVDAAGNAAIAAANIGATSEDQDVIFKCSQAFFFYAQGIEKLMPPKPDPAAQLKAQTDMIKTGAQQAHDHSMSQLQHEQNMTKLAVQASRAVGPTGDNPGNGNRNAG